MTEQKDYFSNWPSRTLCSVLEDMRNLHKTRNYSYLPGLIEEVQVLGNRMEAGLEDQKEVRRAKKELSELKREYNELVDKYNEIASKMPKEKE